MSAAPTRQANPEDENTRRSLWRDRDFMLVWSGSLVSEMGDAITSLALPLAAVLTLHAGAFQVGSLRAAATLAFLLVTLPAGILVDRHRKRPLMISADLGRFALIGSIPVAAALHILSMWQLYFVALGAGLLSVIFDISYQSFVPTLVGRDRLHEGNSKMALPSSFASIVGPSVAGTLVAAAGAVLAMASDAASFIVSSLATWLLRVHEPESPAPAKRPLHGEIGEGLRYVLGNAALRRVVACTATANLFNSERSALLVLYMLHDLHASPARIGQILSLGSLGGAVGGLVATQLVRRIGTARMLWLSWTAFGWVMLGIPLARPGWGSLLISAALFVSNFCGVTYNVAQVSYRQSITPVHLLGRMNASIRWIVWGTLPLGALLGGWLGSTIGLRAAISVGVIGGWLAVLWIVTSPLVRQREISVPVELNS